MNINRESKFKFVVHFFLFQTVKVIYMNLHTPLPIVGEMSRSKLKGEYTLFIMRAIF